MRLLLAIHGNVRDWAAATAQSGTVPRLPFAYAFGAALLERGHTLAAIDLKSDEVAVAEAPFQKIYSRRELSRALDESDAAVLWAGEGVAALLREAAGLRPHRKIILASYVWKFTGGAPRLAIATRLAARLAGGIVLMTEEQCDLARRMWWWRPPVIPFRCGVDTAFYRATAKGGDAQDPEGLRSAAIRFAVAPYAVMLGDELRNNEDATRIAARGVRLVRICKSMRTDVWVALLTRIRELNLQEQFLLLENVSYDLVRLILQRASAYAGLVDSTWQPAGWTAACEALSSGLPVVLYEGLVARELHRIGASRDVVTTIPMGDWELFGSTLAQRIANGVPGADRAQMQRWAADNLDFGRTAPALVDELERVVRA